MSDSTNSPPDYIVSYDEDQGSIQFLYDLTNVFLRPVIKDDLFPEGFLDPDKYPNFPVFDLVDDIYANMGEILEQNKKLIASVGFGIVFAILRLGLQLVYLSFFRKKK